MLNLTGDEVVVTIDDGSDGVISVTHTGAFIYLKVEGQMIAFDADHTGKVISALNKATVAQHGKHRILG